MTGKSTKCKNCEEISNGSIIKVTGHGMCEFCGRRVTVSSYKKTIENHLHCPSCGHTLEVIKEVSDEERTSMPLTVYFCNYDKTIFTKYLGGFGKVEEMTTKTNYKTN